MSQEPSPDRLELYTRVLQNAGETKARLVVNPILPEEAALFDLVNELQDALQPAAPDLAFKARLRDQLLESAARERNHRKLRIPTTEKYIRLPWIAASAAVLGATATLAGAYAVWRWNASRQVA
ncbi:MAG TPA: hypothetical protein EYP25_00125 [Anaerolineae bacterium]|nr:hypothetical protein [Anaerolineae bacterium]